MLLDKSGTTGYLIPSVGGRMGCFFSSFASTESMGLRYIKTEHRLLLLIKSISIYEVWLISFQKVLRSVRDF